MVVMAPTLTAWSVAQWNGSSSWTEAMPELARQLVDRLDDHYIERTVTGVLQQALVAGTQCRRARVSCRSNLDSCVLE